MLRLTALACLLLSGFGGATLQAQQDWTIKSFPIKKHDFGTRAVAAKTEFRFPVFNQFSSPMHIASVRASCGCTTPVIEKAFLQPGETGTILAKFNTSSFKGKKGATVTVVIDQPFFSEVQLRVDGYIRSDMVFHPGSVEFGTVRQGEPAVQKTKLLYAGRADWRVLSIQSNKPWLIPVATETKRSGTSSEYEISVTMREDAPEGFFQDELIVITNDKSMPRVPLPISGLVESALTVAPQAIALGSLKPGQPIDQRLVIKGRVPFVIDQIKVAGWDVKFTPVTTARNFHVVNARFTPTEAVGPQKVSVEIRTAGASPVVAKALLIANIRDQ